MSKETTVCKYIAFSGDNKCSLGDNCICKSNEKFLDDPVHDIDVVDIGQPSDNQKQGKNISADIERAYCSGYINGAGANGSIIDAMADGKLKEAWERFRKSPYMPKETEHLAVQPDHVHIVLRHGAIANVSPDVSPELKSALNEMVDKAYKMPDAKDSLPAQQGEVPEEIMEWIKNAIPKIYFPTEDMIINGDYEAMASLEDDREALENIAIAIYHKMQEEIRDISAKLQRYNDREIKVLGPMENEHLPEETEKWLRIAEDQYSHQKSNQDSYRAGATDMFWNWVFGVENPTRKSFVKFAYTCMSERDKFKLEAKDYRTALETIFDELSQEGKQVVAELLDKNKA